MPQFTCIIPTFNSAFTILQTVDSLLHQSVEDISVIVLNNGSTDGTLEILEKISDPRLTVISYEHLNSLGESLNRCFNERIISSNFFSICHSDDIYSEDFVHNAIHYMKTIKYPTILFCLARQIDQDGIAVKNQYFSIKNYLNILFPRYSGFYGALRIATWNTLFAPSAIFRRADLHLFIGFSESLTLYTDVFFWSNWLLSGYRIQVINQHLLYYRIHGNQQSSWARKWSNQYSEISIFKRLMSERITFSRSFLFSLCLNIHKSLRLLAAVIRLRR